MRQKSPCKFLEREREAEREREREDERYLNPDDILFCHKVTQNLLPESTKLRKPYNNLDYLLMRCRFLSNVSLKSQQM